MPLIDLKTDLKSLRFKSSDTPGDRPGGGWSYQPFVTKNKDYLDNVSIEDLRRTGGKDMLLRGGTLVPRSIFEDEADDSEYYGFWYRKGKNSQKDLIKFYEKHGFIEDPDIHFTWCCFDSIPYPTMKFNFS